MTVQPLQSERPQLILPPDEADALRLAYGEAGVILEYGVGGSTVLASEMPETHITSVESDRGWARNVQDWIDRHPPASGSTVQIIWTDIGPTGDWGHPSSDEAWRRYPKYALDVWTRPDFRHPDVVFVDGRFRIGCALATAFNIERPVTLIFDDYTNRKWHRQVEEFLGEPEIIGRFGVFEVTPTPVPAKRLQKIFQFMTRS